MKIPVDWLNNYINTSKTPKELADSFTQLGLLLDKPIEVYENNDYKTEVLDLEHRMDRSDWLGILGCVRDLAAFENSKLIYPKIHTQKGKELNEDEVIKIKVECPDLVHRFNTRVFKNIKVQQSPEWLKNRLEAYGIPSINNIVDITNFVMVELGQPMHTQDISKLRKKEILFRRAKDGETITTLLGETVELTPEQFVLTQDDVATVLGGIVGGKETAVDETTVDIVLDAGNYDQNNIRKSSRQLKILNETVLRYDKFLHPKLTELAIARATHLILELAGGEYYENEDYYPNTWPIPKMKLRISRLEKIGGVTFSERQVMDILERLEYKVISHNENEFELEVPYFRTDVVVEDDIVADILRINDYENIPIKQISMPPPKEITPRIYEFEEKLRDILVNLDLHEHITDPLVETDANNANQIKLNNALTTEKSALRTSIYDTLRIVEESYKKHGIKGIKLFEIGKIYLNEERYIENRLLQVINTNLDVSSFENSISTKKILAGLMQNLGISEYQLVKNEDRVNIIVNTENIGELSYNQFSLDTFALLQHHSDPKRVITNYENTSTENLSLIADINLDMGKVFEEINKSDKQILSSYMVDTYTNKAIGENKKAILVEITYDTNKTASIRKNLLDLLKEKFDIEHRD